jgi:hypothetical protein
VPREPESFIDGREVASDLQAVDDQVLAIDVLDSWAAVFQLSLQSDGWYETNMTLAGRTAGGWEFMTGGGMWGTGWDLPWIRPVDGWPPGHLLSLGTCGIDVELDDGTDRELIAVCGFASLAVEAISVINDAAERIIVPSETGAYIAVGVGNGFGFLELTPTRDGASLGAPVSFPKP